MRPTSPGQVRPVGVNGHFSGPKTRSIKAVTDGVAPTRYIIVAAAGQRAQIAYDLANNGRFAVRLYLATGHLEEHQRTLRSLVPHSDRIEVRECRHTEQQIQAWLRLIYQRLYERREELSVTAWGTELDPGRGAGIKVWLWPWSEQAAERVRQELDPIPIEVDAIPPGVPLASAGHQRVGRAC